ncbi:MAG: DUF2127 domain-containing protein [Burkholderiaceae bacterium]
MSSQAAPAGLYDRFTASRDRQPAGGQGATLRVIAVIKLIKAVVLIAAGLGALGLLKSNWTDSAVDVLHQLALEHGRRLASAFADHAASMLSSASPARLSEVAVGCFIYGSIFLVEAVGLWTRRRWAEYLTAIVTALLLPFEVDALVHHVTIVHGMALLLNLAVVGYLVFQLWKQRRLGDHAVSRRR